MKQRITPSIKLYLLIFVSAFFLVITGIYAIRNLKMMNQVSESIITDHILPMQHLSSVRYSIGTGLISTVAKLKANQISSIEAIEEVHKAALNARVNWRSYVHSAPKDVDQRLLWRTDSIFNSSIGVFSKLCKLIEQQDFKTLDVMITGRFYHALNPLVNAVNSLMEQEVLSTATKKNVSDNLYRSTSRNFIIFIVLSLLLTIPFGYLIVGNIKALIVDLAQSNEAKAAGDVKFELFIKHAADAILVLDKDWQVQLVNESACRLLGYSSEEFLGMKLQDFFSGITSEPTCSDRTVFDQNGSWRNERMFRTKTNTEVEAAVNVQLLPDTGYVCILHDITESKKSLIAIQESEERYRYLFENNPAFIFIWDLETFKILEKNEQVVMNYGFSEKEWSTMSILNYRPEKDHDKIRELANFLLKNGGPVTKKGWTHFKKNGDPILVDITYHRIIYKGRAAALSLGIDVTKETEIQAKIKLQDERHKVLVENIGDGIFLLDELGHIIYQSASAERISGHSIESLSGKNIQRIICSTDQKSFEELLQEALMRPNESIQWQLRMLSNSGQIIWMEGSIINLLDLKSISGIVLNCRDVTEKMKATELFKRQFDNSPDLILIMNTALTIESINRSLPGSRPKSEYIGLNALDILPTEARLKTIQAVERCIATRSNQEIEVVISSGRYLLSRFVPLITDGITQQILVIATDITERKIVEEKLILSEEKHRALIENITDGLLLLSPEGVVTYQSPSVERIIGYKVEERSKNGRLEFVHPEDMHLGENQLAESFQKPGQPIQSQCRVRHKNGHYIWLEINLNNLLNNPSVGSFAVVYRDITERKKFEEQQSLISSIVNSSEDAIISKSLDGIVTSWNHGAEKVLGFSANEMMAHSISAIIPKHLQGEELEFLNRVKQGLSVENYATQRVKKNGELIYVSLTVSPIFDASGTVIGASKLLRDVSQQKFLEIEREKIVEDLIQRNRDLEQFSYIVSHNLRSPVAMILGITDLMDSENVTAEEKKNLVDGLGISAARLDTVIRDLNDILQIRQGLNDKQEQVVFSSLFLDLKQSIADVIKKEGLIVTSDFTEVNEIMTLKSYMYSIFYNLVTNSMKYRRTDVVPELHVGSLRRDNKVMLIFRDNGLGIDLKHRGDQVFGLYKRFHANAEGRGIGLYMVKTQVESLGGKISVASEVNVGTEFLIEFPI